MLKGAIILSLSSLLLLSACGHKNNAATTLEFADKLIKDEFPYTGEYTWKFNLLGGEQVSTQDLYPDSIVYTMTGRVYSTRYTIHKLSYEKKNGKWIGQDKDGTVYVHFFKEATDSTLTIYKHKCKANGLEEALEFKLPAADATADHGWNVHGLNGIDVLDTLPVHGRFASAGQVLTISDSHIQIGDRKASKLSYHAGERRWVGQYQSSYLQVFFRNLNSAESIQAAYTWSPDLEELYNTKYHTANNWKSYEKQ